MRIVLFTRHYPYANEPFLEEELRILEKEFSEIVLVTYAKSGEILSGYLPENAKVVHLRKGESEVFHSVKALLSLLTIRFWKEVNSGCRERGYSKILSIAKKILLFERRIAAIENKRPQWLGSGHEDTVFYSYWFNPAATYLARNANKLPGICISRAHGEDCFFSRSYIPWREYSLQNIDAVFPISKSGEKDILDHYASRIAELENKVTTHRLGVIVPTDFKVRDLLNDGEIIVSCSNIIPLKRLDLIVEALSLIDDFKVHWIHFGDGPLQDEITKKAKDKLENKENITFEFKGRVSKKHILEYYASKPVGLFINCSDVEGIPVSVMEAMSYGIPTIGRNVGGVSEIIDNSCGLLLPETITATDLKEGILKVLSDSNEEYRNKSENARKKIESEFDCKKNYKLFAEYIKGMMRKKCR